jgi:hypothetical protein
MIGELLSERNTNDQRRRKEANNTELMIVWKLWIYMQRSFILTQYNLNDRQINHFNGSKKF